MMMSIVENRSEETDLGRHMWGLEAKFMHDPTRLDSIRGSVPVKHQGLSHPYHLLRSWVDHRSILPCCFPVARCCRPIRSESRGILSVTKAEEVPLVCVKLRHLFNFSPMHTQNNNTWIISFNLIDTQIK